MGILDNMAKAADESIAEMKEKQKMHAIEQKAKDEKEKELAEKDKLK